MVSFERDLAWVGITVSQVFLGLLWAKDCQTINRTRLQWKDFRCLVGQPPLPLVLLNSGL